MQSSLVQIFAKYPRAGSVKTRMIPAVGPEAAAELQLALLQDICWRLHGSFQVEIWGTDSAAKEHYCSLINKYNLGFRRQCEGDLGVRLEFAVASAFRRGSWPILVGADCPHIDVDLIDTIDTELDCGADAVMVPAIDGGYVALGLSVKNNQLFSGIDWGTGRVAEQTLDAMYKTGIECVVLEPMQDIDYFEDLHGLMGSSNNIRSQALNDWMERHL